VLAVDAQLTPAQARWLVERGLGAEDATVLAIIPNDQYDRMTPAQRRALGTTTEPPTAP
jgi:hypothetical protein